MRVVIIGASGNAGTALLRRLRHEPDLELVGVSRRVPSTMDEATGTTGAAEVEWHACDIGSLAARDQLTEILAGAGAVVNLAWQIQPGHDRRVLYATNVRGSAAVAAAAVAARVPTLVHASSVGTYAPGPKDRFVDESWPATGVPGSTYSRHKALVEMMLDRLEREQPSIRVVRLRPGLIFQRSAGTEIMRYFVGPFLPMGLLRRALRGGLPLVPTTSPLRMQAVHADDVADAYARAILGDARGPFNVVAEPVIDTDVLTSLFRGRAVRVPAPLLQGLADLTWRMRLQPVEAGWIRLALQAPLLSSRRATDELGWRPTVGADAALRELLDGMAHRAYAPTPPLSGGLTLPGRLGGLVRGRLPGVGNPY